MRRRVDRVEYALNAVIIKIDSSIRRMEDMDRMKMTHRERIAKIMAGLDDEAAGKPLPLSLTEPAQAEPPQ